MWRLLIMLCIMAATTTGLSALEDPVTNITFHLGQKYLKEEDWDPIERHALVGADIDFNVQDKFNVAMGYYYSEYYEGGKNLHGTTQEFRVGLRKYATSESKKVRGFIGMGLSHIKTEFGNFIVEDEGEAIGPYGEIGAAVFMSKQMSFGLKASYSTAQVEMFGIKADGGGTLLSIFLGVSI